MSNFSNYSYFQVNRPRGREHCCALTTDVVQIHENCCKHSSVKLQYLLLQVYVFLEKFDINGRKTNSCTVLSNGFIKKTQKTPQKELELALERKQKLEALR
jgi:hypothetical protein